MLKNLKQILAARTKQRDVQSEQASIDAWSLHFGREAAALWVEALSARDTARLSNA
jgi:hypothetical protein